MDKLNTQQQIRAIALHEAVKQVAYTPDTVFDRAEQFAQWIENAKKPR